MKKRRIRIFPIIAFIFVIAIVVFAVNIIVKTFSDKDESVGNDGKKIETIESENITIIDSEENENNTEDEKENENVPIIDEEKVEFNENAPKPLYSTKELSEMFPETVLLKTEAESDSYIDDIIFIGDSTTHGLAFYGVLNGGKETTQVWTPKSGTLAMWNLLTENIVYPEDESEMLICDAIAVKTPKIVVLTLGVNGVSSLNESQFKGYYNDLISEIKKRSSETIIILQSIYPVCDYYEMKSISMEKINQANFWITEIANENEVFYLNTISELVGENGYLINDYCNGDGIHISKVGFNVILDYIKTHSIYKQ